MWYRVKNKRNQRRFLICLLLAMFICPVTGCAGEAAPLPGRAVSLLGAAGVSWSAFLVYLYLFRVKIYNYDGSGGGRYMGSVFVHREAEGFQLRLCRSMEERADTDEFRVEPGRAFCRMHEGEPLLVISDRGKKKTAVIIGESMEFCR